MKYKCHPFSLRRDSSVGISTGYGLDGRGSFPVKARLFSLRSVQTGSGVHPAYYTLGTGDSFPGGKAAGACS
jgi:hypothetical protein